MEKNDILNAEGDKGLIAKSFIDIAKECFRFGVKDVFVSSVTVNTRRSFAFISAVNNILQDKCATHQFLNLLITQTLKRNTSGKMAFI